MTRSSGSDAAVNDVRNRSFDFQRLCRMCLDMILMLPYGSRSKSSTRTNY